MKVSAKLNNLRISPRKVRLITDLIKDLDVDAAINQLESTVKAGSLEIKKLLLSGISNAENNFGIDRNNMYVFNILVGAGSTLKRWMPKAYGRAGQIRKRTSKVELIIEERVEGKGRKSKEELEKEKKKRIEERKKIEKEAHEKSEDKKAERTMVEEERKEKDITKEKANEKKNWAKRIFRRKSM